MWYNVCATAGSFSHCMLSLKYQLQFYTCPVAHSSGVYTNMFVPLTHAMSSLNRNVVLCALASSSALMLFNRLVPALDLALSNRLCESPVAWFQRFHVMLWGDLCMNMAWSPPVAIHIVISCMEKWTLFVHTPKPKPEAHTYIFEYHGE